jgi:hypothetical protein
VVWWVNSGLPLPLPLPLPPLLPPPLLLLWQG